MRWSWVAALLLAALFTAGMSSLMIARYQNYHPFAQDFTDHLQSFHNYLQTGSLSGTITRSHLFHQHLFIIYYPVVILFGMTGERPELLLILQALVVGLSGLPLFAWARVKLGGGCALGILLTYYLYPPLQFGTVFSFYSIPFGMGFITLALYLLKVRHQPRGFGLALFGAVLCHEAYLYVAMVIGLGLTFSRPTRRTGVVTVVLALLGIFLVQTYFFPAFKTNPYYSGSREISKRFYGYLMLPGQSWADRAHAAVHEAVRPLTAEYFGKLFLPLLGLPLLAPKFALMFLLIALPGCFSQFAFLREIYTYYALLEVPVIFAGLIFGLTRLQRRLVRPRPIWLIALVVLATAAWFIRESPLFLQRRPFVYYPEIYTNPRRAAFDRATALVPDGASVLAAPVLSEHLFRRPRLTVIFKDNILNLTDDYILFDLREFNWIVDLEPPFAPLFLGELRNALRSGRYQVVFHEDGVLLAGRAGTPVPTALAPGLEAELDGAFRRAFARLGLPDAGRSGTFVYAGVMRWPSVWPLYRGGRVRIPIIAGGFYSDGPRLRRAAVETLTAPRRALWELAPAPAGTVVPEIDFDLLPEGENRLRFCADGETWEFTVIKDSQTPEVELTVLEQMRDRTRYRIVASDRWSPIEAELRNPTGSEPGVRLTPPLIREWVGIEVGDWYYPFPGGVAPLDREIEVPVAGGPRMLVVRDFAGNSASAILAPPR